MSRCVIISACPVSPELAEALRPDDFIIACDAGYRNCAPLGRRPNIIVGDFDTAPCPEQQDDDIIVLPHVKDDTDTQYAFTRPIADHVFENYDKVLKIDGEVGEKKFYDPRSWGRKAEDSMSARVVEACRQLGSAGKALK